MMRSLMQLSLLCFVMVSMAHAQDRHEGKKVYDAVCAPCHNTGAAGAPKLGDATAWRPRFEGGMEKLYRSAMSGKGAMPARGGNPSLSEAAVQSAVLYMVAEVGERLLVRTAAPRVATANATTSKSAAASTGSAAAANAGAAASASAAPATATASAGNASGKGTYDASCAGCHATGVMGAPRLGDAAAWAARLKSGVATLYASALKGKNAMPAKGGNAGLAEADVKAAVDYMGAQGRGKAETSVAAVGEKKASAAASAASASPVAVAVNPAAAAPSAPARTAAAIEAVASAPAPAPSTQAARAAPAPAEVGSNDVNAFNRLLRSPGKRNLPPMEDGIHDPANDGTAALQPPLAAFASFAKSNAGNRIDWVKTLADGGIRPRADRIDPNSVPAVMDLNIVREVKGSMPDVVYPHKQHTEWLDCSNCHPAIFIPQKGANQISMASILLGQKCGVCHGKVAFPVSECRQCHSRNKPATATAAVSRP